MIFAQNSWAFNFGSVPPSIMNKLIKHIETDWYKYILEVIVIIIGILGAYALNNWNEGRKNAIQEKQLLRELNQNLNSNILEFNRAKIRQKILIESIDVIIDQQIGQTIFYVRVFRINCKCFSI